MENFTSIPDFPDYQVGDLGTIKSLKRGRERILRPSKNRGGYLQVVLWANGENKTLLPHRLVALHFIPNPENLPEVNHLDGDKTNCAKSNLAWASAKGNVQHAIETGLRDNTGVRNGKAKLTPEQVEEIRNFKGQKTQKEIGLIFGICQSYVGDIHKNKNWVARVI